MNTRLQDQFVLQLSVSICLQIELPVCQALGKHAITPHVFVPEALDYLAGTLYRKGMRQVITCYKSVPDFININRRKQPCGVCYKYSHAIRFR